MKKKYFYFIAMLAFGLASCQKGELLNSEADIEEVIFPDWLKNVGVPLITTSSNTIRIPILAVKEEDRIKLVEQLDSLTLKFILTEGATIFPSPCEPKNFNYPQQYTVTSEDGNWKKEYTIIFYYQLFLNTIFDFELARLNPETNPPTSRYYEFFEFNTLLKEEQRVWASGNPGFSLVAGTRPPEDYPTVSVANGRTGKGLKLTTRTTGFLGMLYRPPLPIAAGNLFLGNFELARATTAPLQATKFGVQTTLSKPKSLDLWAKFKPGDVFTDRNRNPIEGRVDMPSIYAVFFEPEKDINGKPIMLDGTNVKTAPNIVSIAIISPELAETITVDDIDNAAYRFISIPFVHKQNFDEVKQMRGEYYFTIVFSSSEYGDLFEGAVGSTLYVDDVELVLE